jgi:hypothetical protein
MAKAAVKPSPAAAGSFPNPPKIVAAVYDRRSAHMERRYNEFQL